jgi:hypothetical protein
MYRILLTSKRGVITYPEGFIDVSDAYRFLGRWLENISRVEILLVTIYQEIKSEEVK